MKQTTDPLDKGSNKIDLYNFYLLKKGEESAFDFLFNSYYSGLFTFALKYINDAHIAEEVVQSVFLKLWKDRKFIEIKSSVKAYLFQSVRNKCLDILKHKKIKDEYARDLIEKSAISNEETWNVFVESELYDLLVKSIEKLPPECQKIFRYSRLKYLKNKEIADKLNISIRTVENQISKALKVLRRELKEYLTIILFFCGM